MNFLNPLLIWGGAAFLIPLAIHLLNRSRYRTIDWGAMHLLESVIKVNHKRFRIEQLILLLIRCAIPVLLALCLARPVLTGAGILEGDTPVSLVIVLDDSYSMDTVAAGGSRFEQAVAAASDIIGATHRGSEIAIILTGGSPTPLFDQPVFDADAVIRKLNRLTGGMGASNIPGALDDALTTLAGMSHARRELVVISDFQPQDWEAVELQGAAFRERLTANEVPIFMTLLPIGQPVTGNLTIESLDYAERALGVGQTLNVRVNLRNRGAIAAGLARVVMRIDGKETAVSQVNLPADSSTQLLFPCQFDSPGSHLIEVQLAADDALPTDNRFAAAVNVWDRVPVLLVDGDPDPQPLQSETDFLTIALTPYTLGRMQLADLLETKTISAQELSETALEEVRVVVLANVSRLDAGQVSALQQFVAKGGALLVFLGNRIDLNWYNQTMYAEDSGLLPASLGQLRGRAEDSTASVRETASQERELSAGEAGIGESQIVVQHFEHPALTIFNDPTQGDLSTLNIRQWYQLKTAIDEAKDASSVIAWLATGDPFIVERRFENGFVLLVATACDDDWSDLPLQPVYVPLMQQLVATLAASVSPPQNLTAGEPAIAVLESSENEDQTAPSKTATLTLPGGGQRIVTALDQGERQVIRYDATQRPGVYTLLTPSAKTVHFVATTSRDESDLGVLEDGQVTELAGQVAAAVVTSSSQYIEQDRLRRHGREIWKYVLAGLLILMLVEIILQQRFARVTG